MYALPDRVEVGKIQITAIPVNGDSHLSFIYIFEKEGKRMVYAPCDIKPFPEEREEVQGADLLVIQPGIFEDDSSTVSNIRKTTSPEQPSTRSKRPWPWPTG